MTRDWGGLGGIIKEAQQLSEQGRSQPLVDCPTCGTPLDTNSAGVKNCPMGHFRAPAGATKGQYQ